MSDNNQDDDGQAGRKGDAIDQLVSVAIRGSSIRTKPGTDPDELAEDNFVAMSDDDEDKDSEETLGARTPAVGARPGSTSDPLPEYWGIRALPPTISAPDDSEPYECAICENTMTARPERDQMALWCSECREFRIFTHVDTE